jgi:hypothetical protein
MENPDSISPSMSGSSQVAFCSGRAVLDEDRLVAAVRRDHAEEGGGADAVGQHLVHVGVGQEVEAHAAVLDGQVGRPEALLPDDGLDLLAQLDRLAARVVGHLAVAPQVPEGRLVGEDPLVHDRRRPHADVVDALVDGRDGVHVHRHGIDDGGPPRREVGPMVPVPADGLPGDASG